MDFLTIYYTLYGRIFNQSSVIFITDLTDLRISRNEGYDSK
ncbi:hypothetical protein NIES19_60720 (plasmid) [Anabaena cylindrica PCC 7122]|nr:hypothetical protein NIES19_60720 [Anabaena cylindrica PCC 7122]